MTFKAKIVAQEYSRQQGIDYDQVFAPVTRQATSRMLLAVASKQNMSVRHLDVKTAYLYGSLNDEILMKQPPGCAALGKEEYMCRLKRNIYGLRLFTAVSMFLVSTTQRSVIETRIQTIINRSMLVHKKCKYSESIPTDLCR